MVTAHRLLERVPQPQVEAAHRVRTAAPPPSMGRPYSLRPRGVPAPLLLYTARMASGYVGILTFDLHFPEGGRSRASGRSSLAQEPTCSAGSVRPWPRSTTTTCGSGPALTLAVCDRGHHTLLESVSTPPSGWRVSRGYEAGPFQREVVTPEDLAVKFTPRMRRVNESLRQVISEAVGDLADPRPGLLTVTGVSAARLRPGGGLRAGARLAEPGRRGLDGLEHARGALQERHRPGAAAPRPAAELRLRRVARPRPAHRRPARGHPPSDTTPRAANRRRDGGRLAAVIERLLAVQPVCVTTHESPDGDALGSLLGLGLPCGGRLRRRVLPVRLRPYPPEYRFLPVEEIDASPRPTPPERVLYAFDCGSARRIGPDEGLLEPASRPVVNVDHHHDNTRFGDVNLVDPQAACTAQIIARLLHALRIEVPHVSAEALYVGLVDRHRPLPVREHHARRPAPGRPSLVEDGVQPARVFGDLGERAVRQAAPARHGPRPGPARVRRTAPDHLARTPGLRRRRRTGRLLRRPDRPAPGRAGRRRRRPDPRAAGPGGPRHKVSLRSRTGGVDVSSIARQQGGGGHKEAAGFSSEASVDEIVAFLRRAVDRAATPADGRRPPGRQARRADLVRTSWPSPGAARPDEGRPRRHARPLRHRAPAAHDRAGHAARAVPGRPGEALPTTVELGVRSDTGDVTASSCRAAIRPSEESCARPRRLRRRARPGAARRLGGQGRRPPRLRAGTGRGRR